MATMPVRPPLPTHGVDCVQLLKLRLETYRHASESLRAELLRSEIRMHETMRMLQRQGAA